LATIRMKHNASIVES